MENKELIRKEEKGMFSRIINYFKNIFYKPKVELIENVQEAPIQEEIKEEKVKDTNDFIESLKVQEVMDYFSILALQNKFEQDEITADDMSDEEYEAVKDLYIQQIEELKVRINQRKLRLGIA